MVRAVCAAAVLLACVCARARAFHPGSLPVCDGADRVYVGALAGSVTPVSMREARVSVAWHAPSLRAHGAALRAALLPAGYSFGSTLHVQERTVLQVHARVLGGAAPSAVQIEAVLRAASGARAARVLSRAAARGGEDVQAELDAGPLACFDLLRNLSAGDSWGAAVPQGAEAWRIVTAAPRARACSTWLNVSHPVLACGDVPAALEPRVAALGVVVVLADTCAEIPAMLATTQPPTPPAAFSAACAPPATPAGTFGRAGHAGKKSALLICAL